MTADLRGEQADLLALVQPQPGMRLFDAGCGTGWLAGVAAELGADATGIDTNALLIEQARARWPKAHFVVADVLRFADVEPFDVVVCRGLLEWLPTGGAAARALASLTRPGGRLLIEMGCEAAGCGDILQEAASLLGGEPTGPASFDDHAADLRAAGFLLEEVRAPDARRRRFSGVRE